MAVRQKKTTCQQYELLNYIDENRTLLSGKTKPTGVKVVEQLWEVFATNINNSSFGPIKTAVQWKKVFIEWKVNTKRKSRNIVAHLQATCGGPNTSKSLTDLEERLLTLISKIHLGDPHLPDTFDEELPGEIKYKLEDNTENEMVLDISSTGYDYVVRRPSADIPTNFNVSKDVKKETPQRNSFSTNSLLKNACDSYAEAAQTNVEATRQQTNATLALADAINNVAEALKGQAEASLLMAKTKREEVKLAYYQTFGNFDKFEI